MMLIGPEFSVVVVEGCAKSLKRCALRRFGLFSALAARPGLPPRASARRAARDHPRTPGLPNRPPPPPRRPHLSPPSFHKLMLRRIDWSQKPEPRADDPLAPHPADDEDEEGEGAAAGKPNACHLVWEGVVKENSFKEFSRQEAASAEAGRALLERAGVAHYWDAATNFDPSAAPLPSAVM
jgi:hypothetical protein